MANLLSVALGGALGAALRYGVSLCLPRGAADSFPTGTWLVNVLGCLAIGALVAGWHPSEAMPPRLRFFVVTGFLGAFTTFSAFGLETYALLNSGARLQALAYVAASLGVGLGAVAGGYYLGARIAG